MTNRSRRVRRLGAMALGMAMFATACGGDGTDNAVPAAQETATTQAAAADGSTADAGGPGLPQLIGSTVSGAQLDTNDLAGQDVVVWFWAPW